MKPCIALRDRIARFARRALTPCLLAPVLLALPAAASFAAPQDPPSREQIDQWIEHAKTGRPAVRPQAAQRLVNAGEPAAARLLELAGDSNRELAALGAELVEVLGAFGKEELRAKLDAALRDPDFPWRPAAARGLAAHAVPADRERLVQLLEDPLAAVRAAAIDGLRTLGSKDDRALVEARLSDEDDRVRRRAAALLADWSERWALQWLVEDLGRTDTFFDRATGQVARYEAWNLLKPRLKSEAIAFKPEWAPTDVAAVEARAALSATLELHSDAPHVPLLARASNPATNEVLGLELRSCRKGEYFLRWNAQDELWVGLGNPAKIALSPGSSERIAAAAKQAFQELGAERFFGVAGCDLEDYLWRPPGASRAEIYRVSKGPQPMPDLRPKPLSTLAAALLATLPEQTDESDPRTKELARRVREALLALGGDL